MTVLNEVLGIKENQIIAFVGAGGKSSLIRKVGSEFRDQGRSFLVTTTTKMFFRQVLEFAPVCCNDYQKGFQYVEKFIKKMGYAGWFSKWYSIKVKGIPPEWIDRFFSSGLVSNVLVEGDGARHKLLKAPREDEPIVPSNVNLVIGVLSLKALGRELAPSVVHRVGLAAQLMGKREGEKIEPQDLAILAGNERGIFQNTGGEKTLVLTGGESGNIEAAEEIIERIKSLGKTDIHRFVVTTGYDKQIKPIRVYPAGV